MGWLSTAQPIHHLTCIRDFLCGNLQSKDKAKTDSMVVSFA